MNKSTQRGHAWITFVQMGAVVICFNTAACIRSIDVERIEMGTDLLQRREVLYNSSLWYHFEDINEMELIMTIPVTTQLQFQGPCLILKEVHRERHL